METQIEFFGEFFKVNCQRFGVGVKVGLLKKVQRRTTSKILKITCSFQQPFYALL